VKEAHPRVFISYNHDDPEHSDRVLALSDRLRSDGIDTVLDQYEESGPKEGWPKWCLREIRNADFVLMICTETYYRRVMGEEKPDLGKGVAWAGGLILQQIYEDRGENTRFIPVLFAGGSEQHIPEPLRGSMRYMLNSEAAYEELYRRLTGQPKTVKHGLGDFKALTARRRHQDFFSHISREDKSVPLYALIAFACGLVLLTVYLAALKQLVSLGQDSRVYYLILIPMAAAASVFVFGVTKSKARYHGKALNGELVLSGAVVMFALIVLGGFRLVPDSHTFSQIVYVHGAGGPGDLVLTNEGEVVLQLKTGPVPARIRERGDAAFPALSTEYRGQELPIRLQAVGFSLADPKAGYKLEGAPIFLPVTRDISALAIKGRVTDGDLRPIAGATVRLDGVEVLTDKDGSFALVSREECPSAVRKTISISKEGYGGPQEEFVLVKPKHLGNPATCSIILNRINNP